MTMQLEPDGSDRSASLAGFGAGGLWALGVGVWAVAARPGVLVALLVLLGPALAIWGFVALAQRLLRLQVEVRALRGELEALHRASEEEARIASALEGFAATQRKVETTLAMLAAAPRRDDHAYGLVSSGAEVAHVPAPRPAEPDGPQASLPLTHVQPGAPLSTADYIRALNFPQTADDQDGFAALRRAMRDREARHLVQAAQDVLTLLSQDGIYMDDFETSRASRPDLWRRFAGGERGAEITALAGLGDAEMLDKIARRMRSDTIFRDTVHHFLRRFDRALTRLAGIASDAEIAALAETRTARAFMLLGRVAGSFD
ncbi:hypothetical protein [Poseidonocella sedimentorum]|uniref:Uncharacterized protein n=1 Tax=Poseidonocella sedimentorum TaxID=871652 RepID=A0A1I6EBE3_9RHOB|nr:hypothetical protein [Poseidonocella sedimentorum]SFR15035.1 hypothetical protein SAMN04515673_10971 [Poseidonocella sedimentorum]